MALILDGTTGIVANNISSTSRMAIGNMPVGAVLQVVNTINATEQYTTSGSVVATSIAASITPYYATSKILVVASVSYYLDGASTQGAFQVYRNNTTQVANFNDACQNNVAATVTRFAMPVTTLTYLDSPATTSSTTYTIYIWRRSGSGQVGVNSYGSSPGPSSGFTLMEIAQ